MVESTVNHSSFTIERSYAASPSRVFSAFADPVKKARWFAEDDSDEVENFTMDFRVGGRESSSFRGPKKSPVEGKLIRNETVYLDIVRDKRIVLAYTMALEENRFSASMATFELLPEGGGTKLVFTEQAAFFENADGPKMREQGWRELLESLAKELES